MAADNIAVVRRYFEEVWSKGHLNMIGELVSDKFVEHALAVMRGACVHAPTAHSTFASTGVEN